MIDRDEKAEKIIGKTQILERHDKTDVGRIIQHIAFIKGYDITVKQGIEIWEAYSEWMMGSFVIFDFENFDKVWSVIEPYFVEIEDKDYYDEIRKYQEDDNDYYIKFAMSQRKPTFGTRAQQKMDIVYIKQLREKTGAPLMKCKQAFYEAEKNIDKAVDLLINDERFSGIQRLVYHKPIERQDLVKKAIKVLVHQDIEKLSVLSGCDMDLSTRIFYEVNGDFDEALKILRCIGDKNE